MGVSNRACCYPFLSLVSREGGMKVYLLKDSDFQTLLDNIDRDPEYGLTGGSSQVLSEIEKRAHHEANRFFNYHIRCWIDKVKE